ncbi:MAG: hypothetical protein KZQ83_07760 [gamma proteobacterium symbiont of Taylorina sp.]|nr:hypothetical protein [gamma proteobacterium symbiont of Taylorina sp.]
MIQSEKSRHIYADLINGRIINKFNLEHDNQLIPNADYSELFSNLESYTELYRNIGFELVFRGSFFFIRDLHLGDTYKEMAIKIQVSLLILARKITAAGFGFDLLENENAGISAAQLEEITQEDEVKQLILAAKLGKKTLHEVVKDVLLEKRIMEKNAQQRYILSDAGKYFFKQLFDQEKASSEL